MAKKKLTIEDVLVPKEEIPYEVPENWCWVRLENTSNIVTGNTPSKNNKEYYGDDIPFIKPTDLNQGRYLNSSIEYLSKLGGEKARLVPKGSISVCCIGATIGKVGYLNIEGATNQQINTIVVNNELLNSLYIYYYMLSTQFQSDLISNSSSTTLPIINKTRMGKLSIPLPPLYEQERIVNRIESLFEKIDRASELVEAAREGFEKRRGAILEKAFSGELTKSWREENNIKNEWKTEKLSQYIKLISGQHIMSKDYNEDSIGVPYLTGPSDFNEIYPVVSKWTESPKAMATTDDILITVKGSGVGRVNICSIDEVAISRQLMAIRCLEINNIYLFWYLKNKFNSLQQLSTGTAIPGLSRGDILDLDINIPLEDEQQKVVDILQDMLSKESQIDNATEIFDNIEVIKKSILAKAFRGELGSNNLEEESSSNLLKYLLEK